METQQFYENPDHKYQLFILFYKKTNRDDNLIEAVMNVDKFYHTHSENDFKNKIIKRFIKSMLKIRVVRSERTGLGKTNIIKDTVIKE